MSLRVLVSTAGVTMVGGIGWLVSMPSGIEIVFNGMAIFGAAYLAAAAAWLGGRLASTSTRALLAGTLVALILLELGLGAGLAAMSRANITSSLPDLEIAVAVAVLGVGCGILAGLSGARPRVSIPLGALLAGAFEVGAGLEFARTYKPCRPHSFCLESGPWHLLTIALPFALVIGLWLGAAAWPGVVAARAPRARAIAA